MTGWIAARRGASEGPAYCVPAPRLPTLGRRCHRQVTTPPHSHRPHARGWKAWPCLARVPRRHTPWRQPLTRRLTAWRAPRWGCRRWRWCCWQVQTDPTSTLPAAVTRPGTRVTTTQRHLRAAAGRQVHRARPPPRPARCHTNPPSGRRERCWHQAVPRVQESARRLVRLQPGPPANGSGRCQPGRRYRRVAPRSPPHYSDQPPRGPCRVVLQCPVR